MDWFIQNTPEMLDDNLSVARRLRWSALDIAPGGDRPGSSPVSRKKLDGYCLAAAAEYTVCT